MIPTMFLTVSLLMRTMTEFRPVFCTNVLNAKTNRLEIHCWTVKVSKFQVRGDTGSVRPPYVPEHNIKSNE